MKDCFSHCLSCFHLKAVSQFKFSFILQGKPYHLFNLPFCLHSKGKNLINFRVRTKSCK